MAQRIQPFHRDLPGIIWLSSDEEREVLARIRQQYSFGYDGRYFDHIAWRMYTGKRKISFSAIWRMLTQAEEINIYRHRNHDQGYLAYGKPGVARGQKDYEDRFTDNVVMAVVFEFIYTTLLSANIRLFLLRPGRSWTINNF